MFRKGILQSNHLYFHKMSLSAQVKKVRWPFLSYGHGQPFFKWKIWCQQVPQIFPRYIPSQLLKSEIHVVHVFRKVSEIGAWEDLEESL